MHITSSVRNPPSAAATARENVVSRFTAFPAWVVAIQLFIGLGWLRAVSEKVIDPGWWTGEAIHTFLGEHRDTTLGWYRPFVEMVVEPTAPLIAIVVVLAQAAAGASLVLGKRLGTGVAVGVFLNLHFMAAGAVTPSAFYLLAQALLALWLAEQSAGAATPRLLKLVALAAGFAAGLNTAFISTLHPAEVIDDPAVMFCFGGSLTVFVALLAAAAMDGATTDSPAESSAVVGEVEWYEYSQ